MPLSEGITRINERIDTNISETEWEFFAIDGHDICRVSIDPSDHPVYETKAGERLFWRRTPVSTHAVKDSAQRDLLIARRWGS